MNLSSHFINHTLNIIKLMFINYYTHDHCSIVSATGISIMSKQASILSFTGDLDILDIIETQLFFDKNINEYKN